MLTRLRAMIDQVCKKMDCVLLEFHGEADHVHILLDLHPKNAISTVAGCLKSSTARMIKKEFPDEFKKNYTNVSLWSKSYYVASTGGATIDKLKDYIKNQDGGL
jgi:putative transposase